jgi:hypothetical protein
MNIYENLSYCHQFLMYKKFPYHSVSVIHRHQDLGFHVMFMDSVRNMVTDEIKEKLKRDEFTWSFVK